MTRSTLTPAAPCKPLMAAAATVLVTFGAGAVAAQAPAMPQAQAVAKANGGDFDETISKLKRGSRPAPSHIARKQDAVAGGVERAQETHEALRNDAMPQAAGDPSQMVGMELEPPSAGPAPVRGEDQVASASLITTAGAAAVSQPASGAQGSAP